MPHIDVQTERIRRLNNQTYVSGPVVYWMSRDQRVLDNWALLHAQFLAWHYDTSYCVVYTLLPEFLHAGPRQYNFMLEGLKETSKILQQKHIPFYLLQGNPVETISDFVAKIHAGILVSDFSPLKIGRKWRGSIAARVQIPVDEVDAHNVIPCWLASSKQEFAAYTIRPKIHNILKKFLLPFPTVHQQNKTPSTKIIEPDWENLHRKDTLPLVDMKSGTRHANEILNTFVLSGLRTYNERRNNPVVDGQSGLSPYVHFGQLGAQTIALRILGSSGFEREKDAFLEELIVRRELAENFCYYNAEYDSVKGFPEWAIKTLDQHTNDCRSDIYTFEEFEQARTHDPLWNASQNEMVYTGKMHGYMRMYWAKKILEWTKTPHDALSIAIRLNDTYEMDGRDPNGYTGIAWSIGGVHDRAWFERPVFGKIRYMSYNGCKSKFDIASYIKKYTP